MRAGEAGSVMVHEVWEFRERLDAFAQRLMPGLREPQVDSGQLQIMQVVNVVP